MSGGGLSAGYTASVCLAKALMKLMPVNSVRSQVVGRTVGRGGAAVVPLGAEMSSTPAASAAKPVVVRIFRPPLSTRGDGRSRMLQTLAMHSAHAPLPASRLDMRACHPAENDRGASLVEVCTPRSRLLRERADDTGRIAADARTIIRRSCAPRGRRRRSQTTACRGRTTGQSRQASRAGRGCSPSRRD